MSNPTPGTSNPQPTQPSSEELPGGATSAPAVEPLDSPSAGDAPAEAAAAESVDPAAAASPSEPPAPEPVAPPEPKKSDWRDRRIAQLTAQLKSVKQSPAGAEADPAAGARLTEDEINQRVAAAVAQREFDRQCNEAAQRGKAAFSDFSERVSNLQNLYTPGNPLEEARYVALLQAVLETDAPERVLYELGGDMDRAEALMSMSPVKLGMEMAKMASKQSAPEPSAAPKPITPISRKGDQNAEIDPADKARADNLSTDTWMARRQKYVEDQRKAGVRMA